MEQSVSAVDTSPWGGGVVLGMVPAAIKLEKDRSRVPHVSIPAQRFTDTAWMNQDTKLLGAVTGPAGQARCNVTFGHTGSAGKRGEVTTAPSYKSERCISIKINASFGGFAL